MAMPGDSRSAVALAESIVVSPDGISVPIGNNQTFSATVTDADGQPVAGVRVDFQVSAATQARGSNSPTIRASRGLPTSARWKEPT